MGWAGVEANGRTGRWSAGGGAELRRRAGWGSRAELELCGLGEIGARKREGKRRGRGNGTAAGEGRKRETRKKQGKEEVVEKLRVQ